MDFRQRREQRFLGATGIQHDEIRIQVHADRALAIIDPGPAGGVAAEAPSQLQGGAIGIIFGLIALIGGVMALQRKKWSLALIGSILGLFMIGLVVLEASILSLIAIILLANSKNEF